jgi:hypothetical protein
VDEQESLGARSINGVVLLAGKNSTHDEQDSSGARSINGVMSTQRESVHEMRKAADSELHGVLTFA